MKRKYLISYCLQPYVTLSFCNVYYDLTIETVYLFGLFRKTEVIVYEILDWQDPSVFKAHWDDIIKHRKPIA
jgi:hypothetical protein